LSFERLPDEERDEDADEELFEEPFPERTEPELLRVDDELLLREE